MELTNGEINRLGESIRNNGYASNEELKKLQEFRISFSEPLFRVFNKIRILSNSINKESIVAFRLKRISTIINKIERENEMKLSRMGDIAGIRCIFNDESEVYKAFELFCKKYEISGEPKNYIKKPKEIGYKAIHIYVVDKVSKKRIEIQIKTIKQHNWATLVEITDLLYRLRLKEIGISSHEKFAKFHYLLSSDKELSKSEANHIYSVLKENDFISKLNKTFHKNNNEVKKRWAKEDRRNYFFLIEASKDKVPMLQSFSSFHDAERAYFEKYINNDVSEIVLTYIKKPDFKQISIAYSNYILSYHIFIKDVQPILLEIALEAIQDSNFLKFWNYSKFKKVIKTYSDLQTGFFLEIEMELISQGDRVKLSKPKQKEIQKSINERLKKFNDNQKIFVTELVTLIPKNFILKFFLMRFLKIQNNRVIKNIEKEKFLLLNT